ncbi:MAG TPA: hypothetical protein VKU77_40235 [Streptosporangiaceae bacterium]|nr:hypothetical protein [Streptosporangiaceae bacterium]
MVDGLLMELEDHNSWSIVEAVGHRGPHRLQHLLSRAVWDEEDHQLAKQAAGLDSGQVIRWRSWHRRSALCLLAYIYLAVTAASHRDRRPGLETGLIPLTIPELVRRRHQYRASQAHRRWHAYADATP